jgi:hypothetical protein
MTMGELIATITRLVSSLSGAPYFARTADGTNIGHFRTVPIAQAAVQRMVGGKKLRWRTEVWAGGVESIRAEGAEYTPLDTQPLATWLDASQGLVFYPASNKCQLWGDFSQSGNPALQSAVAQMPTTNPAGPGGLTEMIFGSLGVDEWMQNGLALAPPYTVCAVLTPAAVPAGVEVAVSVHDGVSDLLSLQVRPGALPRWAMDNGGVIIGPVTGGQPALLTVVQTASGAQFYVGTAQVGANAIVPAAGTNVRVGDAFAAAGIRWNNGISALYIVKRNLFGSTLLSLQNYATSRFQL